MQEEGPSYLPAVYDTHLLLVGLVFLLVSYLVYSQEICILRSLKRPHYSKFMMTMMTTTTRYSPQDSQSFPKFIVFGIINR
jgi:hypothetical protein